MKTGNSLGSSKYAREPENQEKSTGCNNIGNLESDRAESSAQDSYSSRCELAVKDGSSEQSGKVSFQVPASTLDNPRNLQQSTSKPPSGWPAKPAELQSTQPTSPIPLKLAASDAQRLYAGLCTVEKHCETHLLQAQEEPTLDRLVGLVHFHEVLLREYQDFFVACGHPGLQHLAIKHSMAERMWKRGIESLLALLSTHLPDTRDCLVAFFCSAYQRMSWLRQTAPYLEHEWVKILNHLKVHHKAMDESTRAQVTLKLHYLGIQEY